MERLVLSARSMGILLFGALLATGAPAQDPDTTPPFDPVRLGLEAEPLVVDALGLTMHPPAGAIVVAERINGRIALAMTDRTDLSTWQVRVQPLASTEEEVSAIDQIDGQLRELEATQQAFRLVDNQEVDYGGTRGQLCYLETRTEQGTEFATGWLILTTGPRSFLVFTVNCKAADLPAVRRIIEPSFSTIRIQTEDEIASRQEQQLRSGIAFLSSITPARLRLLDGQERWYRVYRPTTELGVETERGFSRVEILAGTRDDLNPGAPVRRADEATGLIVRVQGRVAVDPATDDYYDSLSTYWVSWDLEEEAWSIRGTRRVGEQQRSDGETGVRTRPTLADPENPLGTLIVVKNEANRRTRENFEWSVPAGYLPQAISWVAGQLLALGEHEPANFAFYSYNSLSKDPRLSMRVDRWEATGEERRPWRLYTRAGADSRESQIDVARDGATLERRWPDGTITVPSTADEIMESWRRAGLKVQ